MERWGFLTLGPTAPSLADLYHTGGRRPKQNSPGRCLPLAPHVLLAHRKLQQNKQLTTGIPLSAARRLPAGKISRKPRGRGAEGRPRRARHSAPGGRQAGGSTRGPLSRCRFRSELRGSGGTPEPSGGPCHLGGEGGETSPSPQLPRNCLLPTPGPRATASDNLCRAPCARSTALPGCPAGDPTAGSVGRLCPLIPGFGRLSPLPGSYTRACTKAPFTPAAPPSAPPSRPAALPLPTRSIAVPVGTPPVVAGTGQRQTRAGFAQAPPRGQQILSSRFPPRFL